MAGSYVLMTVSVLAAAGLAVLALAAHEQGAHRAAGRLGEPGLVIGPQVVGAPLGWLALASVPVRRVRHDSIEFEDGAAMLLEDPLAPSLRDLATASARSELTLAEVRAWGRSARLVFEDAAGNAAVVLTRSWRLLPAPPIERPPGAHGEDERAA